MKVYIVEIETQDEDAGYEKEIDSVFKLQESADDYLLNIGFKAETTTLFNGVKFTTYKSKHSRREHIDLVAEIIEIDLQD